MNVGRNQIRNWLSGGGAIGYPLTFAWGSGTTAAAVTDTILEKEIGSGTNAGSIARQTFSLIQTANQEVTYEAIIPTTQGSGTSISEVGIFTTSGTSTGSLYTRTTFNAVTKTSNEEWTAIYIFKLS